MSDAMDRLSKLVAQADRTDNENERDAFMKAAEKMSAAIGVELAVARAHALNKEKREEPVAGRRIKVNDYGSRPLHRNAMMDLFLAIAEAHTVECTISRDNHLAFGYGFESDIKIAEALFAMLSLQMVRAADESIARGDQKWVIDEVNRKIGLDGRVYRRNFYAGFTAKVRARLWEARKAAVAAADAVSGGGTDIVLRDKAQEVRDFYEEETKHLSLRGTYKSVDNSDSLSKDAHKHGALAGARADLGLHDKDMPGGSARALG